MSNDNNLSSPQATSPADPKRRKLATAGLAGTGVMLSVASRSAMGGWGTCTGSELASGNLSRVGTANPCGCSPGYWWNKNGSKTWDNAPSLASYPKSSKFNTVFGVNFFKDSNITLLDCKEQPNHELGFTGQKGAMNTVAMHAVAALLNAGYYGSRYPVSGKQDPLSVITSFKNAFVIGDTALEAWKNTVDIYGKTADLWCAGDPE